MPVTTLPLDPGAQARSLLHHLLETGDIIGRDAAGRTVIQIAASDWQGLPERQGRRRHLHQGRRALQQGSGRADRGQQAASELERVIK
jgi:hypothetical protein